METVNIHDMNKVTVLSICAALTLGGCGTYTGEGAYVGGTFGSILGSAIGGISGGYRGSDIGTVVGMAGGAVLGAAVGSAADKARQEEYRRNMEDREARYGGRGQSRGAAAGAYTPAEDDGSGFDPTHSGDDRIVFSTGREPGRSAVGVYTTVAPRQVPVEQLEAALPGYRSGRNAGVEVRNASFVDRDGDGVIRRGEECKVAFDIMNRSAVAIYDVQPTVVETTGNRHIHISPPLRVESIAPGRGVRYTATVYADSRLKDGTAVIRVAVAQGNNEITSQVKEFSVVTRKK